MAKSHNQKAKILYLAQMLRESGENRVLSMQDILAGLTEYGIQAERKSIYDDIEALRDFGMDVKFRRGRPGGYFLAGQTVAEAGEKAEVVGEVPEGQPGKRPENMPEEQPGEMLENIPEEMLENIPEEQSEEMPENIPEEQPEEISEHMPKEPDAVPDSGSHESTWEETVDHSYEKEWKFKRSGTSGEKPVKLLCSNRRSREVKEYFGRKAEYKDKGAGYFTVTAVQSADPQFFGWLTAMGKEVHIVKPKKVAQAYRDYLKSLAKEYKGI